MLSITGLNGKELAEDPSEWLTLVGRSLSSSLADSTVIVLINMPSYLHPLVQMATDRIVGCEIRMYGYQEDEGAVELMGDTLPNQVDPTVGLCQLRMVFSSKDVDGLQQWKEILIVSGTEEEVRRRECNVSVATDNPAMIILADASYDESPLHILTRPTDLRAEVVIALCRALEAIGADTSIVDSSHRDDLHAHILAKWLDSERRTAAANNISTTEKNRYDQLEMELIQERNRRKTREDVIALCSASASREEECHDLVKQVDEYKSTVESLTSRLLSAETELEASERSRALLAEELKTKSEALLSLWRASSPGQRSNYLKGSNVDVSGDSTVEHVTLKSELANLRSDLADSYADLAQSHSRCQQLEQVLVDTESALQTKCLDFESLLMLQESSEDRVSVLEQQVELLYQEMDGHYSRNLGLEKEINVASKRVSSTQEEYNKLEMKAADLALQLEAAVGELKNEKRLWEQSHAHIAVPEAAYYSLDPTPNNASPNVPTSESPSFERTTSRRGDAPRSSSVSKARTPLLGIIIRDVDGRVRPGASALSKLVASDAARGPRKTNPINPQRLSPKRAVEVPKLVRGVPPPPSLKDVRQKPKVSI